MVRKERKSALFDRWYTGEGSGQKGRLPSREEIADRFKWKTDLIFPSVEAWEEEYRAVEPHLERIRQFQGKLGESAATLLACLKMRDELEMRLNRLYFYASRKSDEDTRDPTYQALKDRITALFVHYQKETAFIQPEILSLPVRRLKQFLKENHDLGVYRHYLDDLLRTKGHILKPAEERILALAGELAQTPYQVFTMFNEADVKFPFIKDETGQEVEVTKGRFSMFMRSADRRVRKDAYRAMYQTYQQWINTLAASLSGAVKRDIFFARARHYRNALEAALDADNIPVKVYRNVIEAVHENLRPLHRYFALRKERLNLDAVRPWDLYVPLQAELKWEVPYEEAVQTVMEALTPLGEEYRQDLQAAFRDGWIDVYENQGKRSGAYSSSTYGVAHPYVLLNYNGQITDLFTLAHELGHAMHSFYTNKNQPYIYSDYTIFVAEVASTLNEALLMDYLLKRTDDPERKLYLLNHYADQIRGTVYIQTIFAEFEKTIHEQVESGGALTAEQLNRLTADLYARYYGPDFQMDDLYPINWCRIPHFYYNFYVYQYATGLSAATMLAQRILDGDNEARKAYLHFLTRGSSDYSLRLLQEAGVDMSQPEPIRATAALFEKLVNQMTDLFKVLNKK